MAPGEAEGTAIAGARGGDRQRAAGPLRPRVDERERVAVGVGVDTDDVGDVVCEHERASCTGVTVVPVVTELPRRDWEESHRFGGQASDQASGESDRHRPLARTHP
jgi:hypothetical protein